MAILIIMKTIQKRIATVLRVVAAAGVAGLLASCGNNANLYPHKGDSRPHPAVARALTLPIQGIDISKWQGAIDWNAVRAAGTRFAYIKATEGGDYLDPYFRNNWYGARAAGVQRGAYHFVFWCRPAHEQVAWIVQNIPRDADALPPVLDVEWNSHSKTCPHRMPKQQALAMIRMMLQALEQHTGKRPMIYTDIPFHADVLDGELFDYAFWIRSTAAEPHVRYNNRPWHFWQFSTTGRIPGIGPAVDRNSFHGGEAAWQLFASTGRIR